MMYLFSRMACSPRTLFTLFLSFALIQLTTASTVSSEVSISAALNAANFSMDQTAILTVDVQGARDANITLPKVKDLQFHSRGQSTQIQVINGDFSASTSTRYVVQAMKPGKYTIPPITVKAGGEKLTTQPIDFQVTSVGTPVKPPSQNSPGGAQPQGAKAVPKELAFVQINKLKEKNYTGEVCPIEIKVYFKKGLKVDLATLPALEGDGFVMPQLDNNPRQTIENINNTTYSVVTWQTSLTGIKEGEHKLNISLDATLLLPLRTRRATPFNNRGFYQDDFFDDFYDDFFGSYQKKKVTITSPEMTLQTLPLPQEGRPENFSGAIGNFSLEVQATPKDVAVGDPITLSMIISGTGNFDRVTAPSFPKSKAWRIYSPSADFQPKGAPYTGKKHFEQAIILKDDSLSEIPPLSFDYFDPASKQYKTLKSTAIALNIQGAPPMASPAKTPPPSPTASSQEVSASTGNIAGLAPIQLHSEKTFATIQPIILRPWFLAITGICFTILLIVAGITLRRKQLADNPEQLKQKQLKGLLATNLQKLEKEATSGSSSSFLDACRRAIQEQLGLLWNREPSAITLEYVKEKLSSDSALITIFAAAEQSAYGGYTLTAQEMTEHQQVLKNELGNIQ